MSSTTLAIPDNRIVFSGQWNDTFAGGHNARQWTGANTQVDFIAMGSSLTMLCNYANNVTMSASVDSGAFTNLTDNGGTWSAVTVFSGLTDTPHTVTLRQTAGVTANFYLDRDTAFTITGASPSVSGPVGFGTQIAVLDATLMANSSREGGWTNTTGGGYTLPGLLRSGWNDARLRFRARCDTVKLWLFQDGGKLTIQRDGSDITSVIVPNTGQYGWVTLTAGQETNVTHEYGVQVSYVGAGSALYAYALMLVGGSGLVTTAYAPRSLLACYGDSIARGEKGTGNDSSVGWVRKVGALAGWGVANLGVNSSTCRQFGSGIAAVTTQAGEATTRQGDVTGLSPVPVCVVVEYGTNDMDAVGGAETAGQFQTSYQAMMTALVAALPKTKFLCVGILPRKDYTASQRAAWTAAIQTVAAGFSIGQVVFVACEGWIDDAADSGDLFDPVHPNANGCSKIAARLLPYVSGPFATTLNVGTESVADDGMARSGRAG